MAQEGRARDLVTDAAGDAHVVAQGRFSARLSPEREIVAIEIDPAQTGAAQLVGARAGSQLRTALAEALPDERAGGTPLYLLLDDIAGSSLVAPWAWSRWEENWYNQMGTDYELRHRRQAMEGVCIGFSPGFSSLVLDSTAIVPRSREVAQLDAVDDPLAWHAFPRGEGASLRRARRIDLWRDRDLIRVDAHFQDSARLPSGGREAVHEYLLSATVDAAAMMLCDVTADPRILPFVECPAAILNIRRLVGTPLASLRQTVLSELARTEGCTHLNDMLRSLAEVPQLALRLPAGSEA